MFERERYKPEIPITMISPHDPRLHNHVSGGLSSEANLPTRGGWLSAWFGPVVVTALLILLLGAIILPGSSSTHAIAWKSVDSSHLRKIGQAMVTYAVSNNDNLPSAEATDVWECARLMARQSELNDATLWASRLDPAVKDSYVMLTTVLTEDRASLAPGFRALRPSWAVVIGKLKLDHPATTPIAWTRGLRADGTWSPDSPYGTSGGHILFLGGNVQYYRSITLGDGFWRPNGTQTVNVFEALPPGVRVSEYVPNAEESKLWSVAERSPVRIEKPRRFDVVGWLMVSWLLSGLFVAVQVARRRWLGRWLLLYAFISVAAFVTMPLWRR